MMGLLLCYLEQGLEAYWSIWLLRAFPIEKKRTGKCYSVIQIIVFFLMVIPNAWNLRVSFVSTAIIFFTSFMWTMYVRIFFRISFQSAFCWMLFCNCNYLFVRTLILLVSAGMKTDSILILNYLYSSRRIASSILFISILAFLIHVLVVFGREVLSELVLHHSSMLAMLFAIEWILVIYIFNVGQRQVGMMEMGTGILCLLMVVMMLFVQIMKIQNCIINTERAATDMKKKIAEQQFLSLKEEYKNSRKMLHNKKYEMQYIVALLEQEKYDAVKAFVENSFYQIKETQQKMIWTGITEVDVLLNHLNQQCEKEQSVLQLDCNIQEIPIEMQDFCIILGNLFDNALEAVQQCQTEKRFIGVALRSVNQMIFIEVINVYHHEPILKKDGRFKSWKSGLEHGWGLESVKDIVNKNQGSMEIKFIDHEFYVSILI